MYPNKSAMCNFLWTKNFRSSGLASKVGHLDPTIQGLKITTYIKKDRNTNYISQLDSQLVLIKTNGIPTKTGDNKSQNMPRSKFLSTMQSHP